MRVCIEFSSTKVSSVVHTYLRTIFLTVLAVYGNTSIAIPKEQSNVNLMKYLNIPLDPIFGENSDLLKNKPHLGALKVTKCCDDIDITILYNDTSMHSLPIILNAINNALYR